MGDTALKSSVISLILLLTAGLAGCAPGPAQTRFPRPPIETRAPAPEPEPPAPQPDVTTPAEPEVETMPLERTTVAQPQRLPEPEPVEGGIVVEGDAAGEVAEVIAEPEPPANPVVAGLLRQADALAAGGQLDRAAASVERGLRIAPKDATLWQKLARIRLQQGQYTQAESMAKKAISLARGRPGMIADNWKIIAEARQARGDVAGARRALDKMLQYSSAPLR